MIDQDERQQILETMEHLGRALAKMPDKPSDVYRKVTKSITDAMIALGVYDEELAER